jgi:hypothetical protein
MPTRRIARCRWLAILVNAAATSLAAVGSGVPDREAHTGDTGGPRTVNSFNLGATTLCAMGP